MAETVNMPKLGFDMAEGTLVRWVIAEGQPVHKGAVLAEIETDKATVEVESNFEGIVARHLVDEKDVVPVNTPIAIITAPGEEMESKQVGAGPRPARTDKQVASTQVGAGPRPARTDKQVASTQVGAGSEPARTDEQVASTQVGVGPRPARTDEQVASTQVGAGSEPARTDEQVASTQVGAGSEPARTPEPARTSEPAGTDGQAGLSAGQTTAARASPIAKRLAREKGIDLATLAGTGPGGRIVKKDVESAVKIPVPMSVPMPATEPVTTSQQETKVPLTRLRAAIARRMAEAKQQAPHFYITHEYDMAALMALRKQINGLLLEAEKISVNDLIIKAVALTLKSFPNLNASFRGNEVVQHGAIHIGIAVAVEGGLLTVVCRNTDQKAVRLIASEVKSLVSRVREGKVRPDDIEGSTFSVSNLGMYDVEEFSAIINPPEAAILAVGSVKDVPVVKDGQLAVGTRMRATISVDHRVSDGVEAAKFMQALAEPLENPLKLLL